MGIKNYNLPCQIYLNKTPCEDGTYTANILQRCSDHLANLSHWKHMLHCNMLSTMKAKDAKHVNIGLYLFRFTVVIFDLDKFA